jgi:hypothetical protein
MAIFIAFSQHFYMPKISEKTYINVPYAQKDAAKALGAKWDASNKKWYVPADKDITLFTQWHNDVATPSLGTTVNSTALGSGVMTFPSAPNFVAYSGAEPPWD